MSFFDEVDAQLAGLRSLVGDASRGDLAGVVAGVSPAVALTVVEQTSAVRRALAVVESLAVAVIAEHSGRGAGQRGFAQVHGHRTPVSLVQEITGSTRADVSKQIRVGESLLAAVPVLVPVSGAVPILGDGTGSAVPVSGPEVWHAVLGEALTAGVISADQHDAIRQNLGEPPLPEDAGADQRAWVVDAWATAAAQLVEEAGVRTVEELRGSARLLRDILDPEGAARRFDERFAARAFRMWVDADGLHRASWVFDDESAAWVRAILDAALRPRRGGPRFVDAAEAARAADLAGDPRTNDQLAFDLMMDVLRSGALADAESVFGTRQAGVRVVVTARARHVTPATDPAPARDVERDLDRDGDGDGRDGMDRDLDRHGEDRSHSHGGGERDGGDGRVGYTEDGGNPLPAWLIDQRRCDTGATTVTTDRAGNPLYPGREQRLFSVRQKLALALRDGGCRWRGCDRPASYCEAHHIDPHSEGGRTDIDRGILLCRFHHMNLHHGGWRITRHGSDEFMLHPPGGGRPIPLPRRVALRYAWDDITPPPPRFRTAA